LLKSMTGYGRGEYSKDGIWIIVELRSLNNRYRDIVLRIPSNFQWLDVNIRSMVSNRVKRGRVEVSVKMTNTGEIPEYDLELNIPLASSYVELIRELGEQFGLDTSIRAESLCQIKDILKHLENCYIIFNTFLNIYKTKLYYFSHTFTFQHFVNYLPDFRGFHPLELGI